MHAGFSGELIFSPCIPTEGLRIVAFEPFFQDRMRQRIPDEPLNIPGISAWKSESASAALRLVFTQIRQSMDEGIVSELYYECKVAELLLLDASGNSAAEAARSRNIALIDDDFNAVCKE
ncbi:MAG: hypothetical protein LBU32_22695 [Clostridiales bacterium]|nr:hypothetical protein [Clostridiales bacterium]